MYLEGKFLSEIKWRILLSKFHFKKELYKLWWKLLANPLNNHLHISYHI